MEVFGLGEYHCPILSAFIYSVLHVVFNDVLSFLARSFVAC